jgi:hypothetical protein
MRVRTLLLLGALLALLPPTTAGAQGQDCELLPGAREANRKIIGGQEVVHISGPARFVCPGEVVLQADSAVGSPDRGEFELLGNVFYQDSVKTLTAAWARYDRPDARLLARENVVLTDRKSRSVIQGAELEYLPANEVRPESEAIVQGRPHAIFQQQEKARPEGDASGRSPVDSIPLPDGSASEPADSAAQPLEVDADLMRIFGDSRFLALGQVELTRGETRGYAREGEFDQAGNTMVLTGAARLVGEGYTLVGDRIEATLDGDRLDEVVSRRDAGLEAEDLDLKAPELRIFFQDGEVHRLVAIGDGERSDAAGRASPEPVPVLPVAAPREHGGAERAAPPVASQPVITSRDFRLAADSIDALAPGQQIEQVIAVGHASGIRTPDSLDVGLPESIAFDWLVGDTITGYFAREAAPDSAPAALAPDTVAKPMPEVVEAGAAPAPEPKPRAVLERLVAVGEGGGARSLYRIREKGRESEPPSANYIVANRIVLVMSEGEVKDVEADGPIEGIHLQPAGRAGQGTPPAGDTTGKEPTGEPSGGRK